MKLTNKMAECRKQLTEELLRSARGGANSTSPTHNLLRVCETAAYAEILGKMVWYY